jgi:hypothetical protein
MVYSCVFFTECVRRAPYGGWKRVHGMAGTTCRLLAIVFAASFHLLVDQIQYVLEHDRIVDNPVDLQVAAHVG